MAVCIVVIRAHVFEVPTDVLVEEALDFRKVELGVDKQGTNIGLDDIR